MGAAFRDRQAAGAVLADRLRLYAGRSGTVVLGLARGGVPVAAEVAARLGAPLDVLVVRKLGVPWAPEVAFGALGPHGVRVLNDDIASRLEPGQIAEVTRAEEAERARREARFRRDRPPLDLAGHTVIIVDDGLATGATARAAVVVARRLGAERVVLAVPVGSTQACEEIAAVVDDLVCPLCLADFGSVSRYYHDFHQVTDGEVGAVLAAAGWADRASRMPPGIAPRGSQ
ncbi:phosphoribosyltransferase family protein [Phytohabitans sp. ZYX-F-186]|uniref:Phosphoribosyltransferase family protein n=1 Tax=Phytohabitans maris TaxID=3071409 RepID=A0ABU0ZJ37_9ACTN|nr:phosphoribosyltransferase family protein [Phytohabitans sp. ZYX-F-186]MDQ7907065.1 phosphoribosyltransferase family protein [Phytohabitans sp. ZYX-F-186]